MELLTGDNWSVKVRCRFFAEKQGVAVLSLEKQRVTAEGKRRTDFTDTAVDLACSRAYFLHVLAMTAVTIIGCSAYWRA